MSSRKDWKSVERYREMMEKDKNKRERQYEDCLAKLLSEKNVCLFFVFFFL
jgi:hypothetical protein